MGNRRNVSNRMIITIASLGFVLMLIVWLILGYISSTNNEYDVDLDEHWTVYINNELLCEDTQLSEVNFGTLSVNDQVDMYVDLPDTLNGGYTVGILVYLCSFEAFIDDECLYSYGTDLIGKDVMVGSGYHFVDLPQEITGKQLHIRMIMNEYGSFTSISTPKCAKTSETEVAFAKSQLINCLIGMFLVVLGGILFVVSVVAIFYDRIYLRLIYIGWFSLLMGGWTLFSNKVYAIFTMERLLNTNLEYMTLYFAPVPFALLIYDMRKEDKSWRGKLVLVMSIILTAFASVSTILHFLNIVRYPEVLTYFHVIAFSCIFIMIFAGYLTVKEKTNAETVTIVAMLMITGILALDIGRFNIQKYIFPNASALMNSFIPLGTMVFVIMLLVSYLIYMYDMVMTNTEKDMLTKLAYHDVLTGLYNRTKYEEVMAELEESKEDFALISMDLNDLKYVNDTYGHNKGDHMLVTFAEILHSNFDEIGLCFRTGGDEYIVIVHKEHMADISQALVNMNMDEKDESKDQIYEIQASYGIAYRSEIIDGQAFKVFRLADRRMYEMKSQAKGKEYVFGADTSKIDN